MLSPLVLIDTTNIKKGDKELKFKIQESSKAAQKIPE